MLELTFLTSNIVKLEHASYIADQLPIRVVGFRQRTYHATYFEPRVSSRKELLEKSYRNALEQCRRAGISTRNQFFILEDTSVRVDALSTQGRDFPGLEIKYWMEKTSFSELDSALRLAGNDRSAQVRSDVLMHVPDAYRSVLKVKDKYLIFTGKQTGHVVESEIDFESNLVFPWLDNRTFNKWFCPKGFELPLGALEISEADGVDFRGKAFEKMFSFLYSCGLVAEIPLQMNLSLSDNIDFILCGYTCAGKTTASQHLAREYGYLHIEASDFMHLNYFYRHGYQRNIPIGYFAEQALVQLPHIVAEKVAEYILEEEPGPIVASGFRSIVEVDWLLDKLAFLGRRFEVVFIDSEPGNRFDRIRARNRVGDGISFSEFEEKDDQQGRMGLRGIRESDSVTVWTNDGGLDAYLQFVGSRVMGRDKESRELDASVSALSAIDDVKLEDSILVGLLSVWTTDETREYFSTSEIAAIINSKIFPNIRPKHRENVHRYFNQDFYVYYEIDSRNPGRVRVYRLSNTGYGRALRAVRSLGYELNL